MALRPARFFPPDASIAFGAPYGASGFIPNGATGLNISTPFNILAAGIFDFPVLDLSGYSNAFICLSCTGATPLRLSLYLMDPAGGSGLTEVTTTQTFVGGGNYSLVTFGRALTETAKLPMAFVRPRLTNTTGVTSNVQAIAGVWAER